eukprot:scaffold14737_cov68-Phaeocystis_antarctica.AAC.12
MRRCPARARTRGPPPPGLPVKRHPGRGSRHSGHRSRMIYPSLPKASGDGGVCVAAEEADNVEALVSTGDHVRELLAWFAEHCRCYTLDPRVVVRANLTEGTRLGRLLVALLHTWIAGGVIHAARVLTDRGRGAHSGCCQVESPCPGGQH